MDAGDDVDDAADIIIKNQRVADVVDNVPDNTRREIADMLIDNPDSERIASELVDKFDESGKIGVDEVISENKIELGKLIGSLDGLTSDERKMVNDLLKQGKNIEIIPKDPKATVKTPDFLVDEVKTELKTLQNPNTNTGMKRIQEAFGQGADVVIIDRRKANLTKEQAMEILNQVKGKFQDGQIPGKIEIWINGEIVIYP